MGVNFIKKTSGKISSEIKFEIENVEYVRQKLWVENLESKILSDFKLNKTGMDRFQDCCKAKLLTHNYKVRCLDTIIICNN